MGGSQNNKVRVCKKVRNRSREDDKKHGTVNFNVTGYNELENKYACINPVRGPKEENYTVADSGFTGNFMAVSVHLNNVLPTTSIINAKFTNGQIIVSIMEGELY